MTPIGLILTLTQKSLWAKISLIGVICVLFQNLRLAYS